MVGLGIDKIFTKERSVIVEKLKDILRKWFKGVGKKHIFIAVYVVLIIIELFFYVPYNNIQIFKSKQNVPHTEIIGSGYSTMADISKDDAYLQKQTATGKIVNTQQLFINVSITTIAFVAVYLIFLKSEKDKAQSEPQIDFKTLPEIDVDSLAFADEETVEKAKRKYAVDVYRHITGNNTPNIFDEALKETKNETQLSLLDVMKTEKENEEIIVHTISPQNGYSKSAIERTNENSTIIDKWIDKSTGCLYTAVMYRDGKAEKMFVTKELFETIYKSFDI